MGKTFEIGSPPILVHMRRSARARRYSLKVSSADGQAHLIVPNNGTERDAMSFAGKQEFWLRAALAKVPDVSPPEFGGQLLFEGRTIRLRPGLGRRIYLNDDSLEVPGRSDQLAAKLRGFLKVSAREKLVAASHKYAHQVEREVSRVTLRDTRSRWGSCTEAGNLMYSWRLIMAPPMVLNYVAAHEVAHLVEMNHSANFWSVVSRLMPDYSVHRKWLKQNGAELHRVQL
ncbi:MAG: putative metal-dependent hydrolase [Paracoccaceae bacterium]|jgi:predicted metal-dependent hydrolase